MTHDTHVFRASCLPIWYLLPIGEDEGDEAETSFSDGFEEETTRKNLLRGGFEKEGKAQGGLLCFFTFFDFLEPRGFALGFRLSLI